jgi:hypothetical protein
MLKHTEKGKASQVRSRRPSLFLTGGFVLLVGGALLIWSLFFRSPTRPSAPSVQYSPPQPPIPLSVAYEDSVKQSLAQQLRVEVGQLAHETRTNQDGLFGVADSHGLSQDQLHTMLLHAFQSASDQMVRAGHWTNQQAGSEMQYWKQREFKALTGDVTSWLLR